MENYYQKDMECASRAEMVALQNERLVAQVKHVYISCLSLQKMICVMRTLMVFWVLTLKTVFASIRLRVQPVSA